MENVFYIDGKFLKEREAKIPVYDLGLLRSYGVFDFLRTYNRKPFYLKDHLKRLLNSAKIIGLKHNYKIQELEKLVILALNKNKHLKEANIRIILTGGDSYDFITPAKPRLIIMITPVKELDEKLYEKGAKLITKTYERINPNAKTLIYCDAIKFLQEAKRKKAVEVLLIDKNNEILECTTSNFFAVINKQVITPLKEKILEGITRKLIINLCRKYKIPLIERKIYKEEIKKFNECFITASNKEILPIIKIDDFKISSKPGEITNFLMERFKELTKNY